MPLNNKINPAPLLLATLSFLLSVSPSFGFKGSKEHAFTSMKIHKIKKCLVLFLLLSQNVSGSALDLSTSNGGSTNHVQKDNDGKSSSLPRVAPLLSAATNASNQDHYALTGRSLSTITIDPSSVRQAIDDAANGDIIRITPGEVDLSSGELHITKAMTIECTEPTQCIFDAKASSSNKWNVIYDKHGKAAPSRYTGIEITGGYVVSPTS